MSIAAAALALAREFEFPKGSGTVLKVAPLTYERIAMFSLWLEERAQAAAERGTARDGNERAWRQAIADAAASGKYEPGGSVFVDAMTTDVGLRKVLELMLVMPAEDATRAAWSIYSDDVAFAEALKKCREANKDPKAQALRCPPISPAGQSH